MVEQCLIVVRELGEHLLDVALGNGIQWTSGMRLKQRLIDGLQPMVVPFIGATNENVGGRGKHAGQRDVVVGKEFDGDIHGKDGCGRFDLKHEQRVHTQAMKRSASRWAALSPCVRVSFSSSCYFLGRMTKERKKQGMMEVRKEKEIIERKGVALRGRTM